MPRKKKSETPEATPSVDVVNAALALAAAKARQLAATGGDAKYGRRPDLDGLCQRCKLDGHEQRTHAFRRPPEYSRKRKNKLVRPAETVQHCPRHQSEVATVAA